MVAFCDDPDRPAEIPVGTLYPDGRIEWPERETRPRPRQADPTPDAIRAAIEELWADRPWRREREG